MLAGGTLQAVAGGMLGLAMAAGWAQLRSSWCVLLHSLGHMHAQDALRQRLQALAVQAVLAVEGVLLAAAGGAGAPAAHEGGRGAAPQPGGDKGQPPPAGRVAVRRLCRGGCVHGAV